MHETTELDIDPPTPCAVTTMTGFHKLHPQSERAVAAACRLGQRFQRACTLVVVDFNLNPPTPFARSHPQQQADESPRRRRRRRHYL